MKKYRVIGPPGTGKTRNLLQTVQKAIDEGISLDNIGYFAFTRKAANEARDRFLKDNVGLTKKDLPYFQTLHSFAFNQLGLKEENVMQEEHYKKIGDTCGIQIKYVEPEYRFQVVMPSDDKGEVIVANTKLITTQKEV